MFTNFLQILGDGLSSSPFVVGFVDCRSGPLGIYAPISIVLASAASTCDCATLAIGT